MNWEAIGAIGQMLGSVAVLVTLGYLAIQVRHARAEMRRSISQTRAEGGRELLMNFANSEQLCNLYTKVGAAIGRSPNPVIGALMARAGLTQSEAMQLLLDHEAWFQYQAQVIQYINELSAGERFGFDGSIRGRYGHDAGLIGPLWYEDRKAALNPDAVRYIDNLLAQPV